MLQPDVTITVECVVLTLLLRGRDGAQRGWLALLLMAVAVAAVAAGTVHGFYPDPGSPARNILWRATMLALGTGTLAAWALGVRSCSCRRPAPAG